MQKINTLKTISIHIIFVIFAIVSTVANAQDFTSSNLPIIVINTNGTPINNVEPIRAKMKIVFHEDGSLNHLSDTNDFRNLNYNGDIDINIRGYTSQYIEKKPYKIHTFHAFEENNNVSLLGLPPENDWILINMAFEPSYIRDFVSYGLMTKMGNYAPRCRFCEVVIDDNYKGLYIFTEKMKAGKNRIDIEKPPADQQIQGDIMCGYIFKADREEMSWEDQAYHNYPNYPIIYTIKYPQEEYISQNQIDYIRNYYFNFTELANNQDEAIDVGFPSKIDIQSFIDFMLISEFSSNVDIYQLSTYFHKDTRGKLRAGPIWDFNLTFGNDIQTNRSRYNVWQFSNYDNEGAKFWTDLFNNPTYRCHMSKRWHELTAEGQPLNNESVFSFIDETSALISDAITRDCQIWNKIDHHESNIDSLKTWINNRINWMNNHVGSYEQCQDEYVPKLVISRINYYPKPQGFISSDRLEFIEITNNSDERVNLTGIYFGGMGLSYVFPINSYLEPNQKAVICSDSLQFVIHYGQIPFGQYARHLSNQSQRLVLYDVWGNLIDEVTYSCNPPWPEEANGRGSFLELIDICADNSRAENWRAAEILSTELLQQSATMVYPNPFTDLIQIRVKATKTTYSIINAIGHEVISGESSDDTISINTSDLPAGIYVVRITSDGETICQKIVKGIKG